jgi:hypothetical protein
MSALAPTPSYIQWLGTLLQGSCETAHRSLRNSYCKRKAANTSWSAGVQVPVQSIVLSLWCKHKYTALVKSLALGTSAQAQQRGLKLSKQRLHSE